MSSRRFEKREYGAGHIDWSDGDKVVYWYNGSIECWIINHRIYSFDEWLNLVELPHEEKVWLRLHFG